MKPSLLIAIAATTIVRANPDFNQFTSDLVSVYPTNPMKINSLSTSQNNSVQSENFYSSSNFYSMDRNMNS